MRRRPAIAVVAIVVLLTASDLSLAGGLSIRMRGGGTKVTGDKFEDSQFRMITGVDLLYPIAKRFHAGLRVGYSKWEPTSIPISLVGSSRMVDGTISNVEIAGTIRYDEPLTRFDRLSIFGEAGIGFCLLNSKADVYSRPVIPDPGPWEYLYTIDSENRPSFCAGAGLNFRVTELVGLEALAAYSYIFTADEPTKFYSFNGCIVLNLF
ncbi:MAG: hypothetical protein JW814_11865 [Candidatus Krumholzibacteriota bacterium]|nr:hypothetical protein [Candidatus Krumholzibacteriota bacterium]